MPSTLPYVPTFNFPTDPAPQRKVNDVALQGQLQLIAANLAQLMAALGVAIGPDDTLTDGLVRIRNLHPELVTYIESAISGTITTKSLDYFYPVRSASNGNNALFYGPQTVGGVLVGSGDFVLLKDQVNPAQNGLWEVHAIGDPAPNASGQWVRRDDLPAGSPCGAGWAVCVREGVNAQTVWAILAGGVPGDQPVVGTDPMVFFPVHGILPTPVSAGGTGASTAAGARANLGVPGKWVQNITGDGVAQSFNVNHNLGSSFIIAGAQDSLGIAQGMDYEAAGTNDVTCTFQTPPALGEVITITVIG